MISVGLAQEKMKGGTHIEMSTKQQERATFYPGAPHAGKTSGRASSKDQPTFR